MLEQRISRVYAISSAGVEYDAGAPWYFRALLRPYLINNYLDMVKMETILEESPSLIEWTIVRPTYLLDGPSGQYLVSDRTLGKGSRNNNRDVL